LNIDHGEERGPIEGLTTIRAQVSLSPEGERKCDECRDSLSTIFIALVLSAVL
jgi:hypothetical protein